MLHPFMTAELVRERRAELEAGFGRRRLARPLQPQPDATVPIGRPKASAVRRARRSLRVRRARAQAVRSDA